MRQGNFGLAPYDRSKNKPVDMGLGGLSTEYLATEYDANGNPFNVPQMWFDKNGNPVLLPNEDAIAQAAEYEALNGPKFRRFDNIGAGVEAAQHRSAQGGADRLTMRKLFGN